MTMTPRLAIMAGLLLLSAACAYPNPRIERNEPFLKSSPERKPWRTVAVLPFAGEPAFRLPAAEWLAHRLRERTRFEVIDPSLAEIRLEKSGIAAGSAGKDAGRALGADGVVSGSVRTGAVGAIPTLVLRVEMVDSATGTVGASGEITSRERDPLVAAAAAVDALVRNLMPALRALAALPETAPSAKPPESFLPPEPW